MKERKNETFYFPRWNRRWNRLTTSTRTAARTALFHAFVYYQTSCVEVEVIGVDQTARLFSARRGTLFEAVDVGVGVACDDALDAVEKNLKRYFGCSDRNGSVCVVCCVRLLCATAVGTYFPYFYFTAVYPCSHQEKSGARSAARDPSQRSSCARHRSPPCFDGFPVHVNAPGDRSAQAGRR